MVSVGTFSSDVGFTGGVMMAGVVGVLATAGVGVIEVGVGVIGRGIGGEVVAGVAVEVKGVAAIFLPASFLAAILAEGGAMEVPNDPNNDGALGGVGAPKMDTAGVGAVEGAGT